MFENYFEERVGDPEIKEEIEALFFNGYKYDDTSSLIDKYDTLVENRKGIRIKIDAEKVKRKNRLSECALISKFMVDHDPKLKKYYQETNTSNLPDIPKKIRKIMNRKLQLGIYHTKIDTDTFLVCHIDTFSDDVNEGYVGTKTTLYFLGKKAKHYYNKYIKFRDETMTIVKKIQQQNLIWQTSGREMVSTVVHFKSFDQMIFSDKDRVIKYVDNWKNNVATYYTKYHIIPKLSILLYGPPGTGKSTFYQALANHFGLNECFNVLPSHFSSVTREDRFFGPIVMDDLDTYVENREESKGPVGDRMNRILAFLDHPPVFDLNDGSGILYPVSIVVATTNYYDRLDPAIVRAGRFDLKIEMNYFNYDEASLFCQLYNIDLNKLYPNIDKDKFTICPAELEATCLNNLDAQSKEVNEA